MILPPFRFHSMSFLFPRWLRFASRKTGSQNRVPTPFPYCVRPVAVLLFWVMAQINSRTTYPLDRYDFNIIPSHRKEFAYAHSLSQA